MGAVLNRTTKEYLTSVNEPDFPVAQWVINPDVLALQLAGVPTRYWKILPGDIVVEMNAAEKQVVDDSVQRIRLRSSAAADFDGVPVVKANGKDVHTITIDKLNLVNAVVGSGSESLRVNASSPIAVSDSTPALVAGLATITIGPTKQMGDIILACKDSAGNLITGELTVRFRSVQTFPEGPLAPFAIFGARLNSITANTVSIGTAGQPSAMRDRQNAFDIIFSGVLTADITVSGANGLQTGLVEQPNTWYAVLVIADSTGVNPVALLLTDTPNNPTLPPGYDVSRRVGWVRNNGSSNFLSMIQTGRGSVRTYNYDVPVAQLIALSGGNATVFTAVSLAALVPPSSRIALVGMNLVTVLATDRARIRPTGSTVTNPGFIFRPGLLSSVGVTLTMEVVLNANQSLDYILDSATGALDLGVLGFTDEI